MILRPPPPPRSAAGRARARARQARESESEPAISPLALGAAGLSLAFLGAALLWPPAAEALLRLLLVTLAVGYAAARIVERLAPVSHDGGSGTPFERAPPPATAPATPHVLRDLRAGLAGADTARRARRTPVPMAVRWTLAEEARRRLAERHGLSADEARHQAAIRARVSDPTWRLLRPEEVEVGPDAPGLPLSDLERILEDLESL